MLSLTPQKLVALWVLLSTTAVLTLIQNSVLIVVTLVTSGLVGTLCVSIVMKHAPTFASDAAPVSKKQTDKKKRKEINKMKKLKYDARREELRNEAAIRNADGGDHCRQWSINRKMANNISKSAISSSVSIGIVITANKIANSTVLAAIADGKAAAKKSQAKAAAAESSFEFGFRVVSRGNCPHCGNPVLTNQFRTRKGNQYSHLFCAAQNEYRLK